MIQSTVALGIWNCEHFQPTYPASARRANSYTCRIGAKAGEAHLLLSKKALDSVKDDASNLVFDQFAGSTLNRISRITIKSMRLVQAEKLFKSSPDNPRAVYYCVFADQRILAERHSSTGTLAYNFRVRASSEASAANTYWEDSLNSGSVWTWQGIVTDLWPAILGSAPTLPYTPSGTPENWVWHGRNRWFALEEFLQSIQCEIVYNPLTDAFSIAELGAAQTITLPTTATMDFATVDGAAVKYPEKIRVWFGRHHQSHGQEIDDQGADNWGPGEAAYSTDVTTSLSGAVTGTILDVWDSVLATYDEDNTLSNSSALATRASEIADKIKQDLQTPDQHQQHAGILQLSPGARIKSIRWHHRGTAANSGGMVTDFRAGSSRRATSEFGEASLPAEMERLSAPRLAAPTWPHTPRVANVVQVWHGEGYPGTQVDANADGFHPGRVKRIRSGTMTTYLDCWILFVDDYDNAGGDVSAIDGDYYGPARLCGVIESDSTKKPLYLVRSGQSGNSRIRFSLTAALATTDASKAATLQSYLGGIVRDAVSSSITVYNMTASSNYVFEGDSGNWGKAEWDEINGRWEIYQMECPS